jgi:flagellar biosynthesis regulator FlbT
VITIKTGNINQINFHLAKNKKKMFSKSIKFSLRHVDDQEVLNKFKAEGNFVNAKHINSKEFFLRRLFAFVQLVFYALLTAEKLTLSETDSFREALRACATKWEKSTCEVPAMQYFTNRFVLVIKQ